MMDFYHGNDREKTDYRQREDENFGTMFRENEKKLRREIANSNERRRMQSINAGFQSLRALLPKTEGDKLSKAAILQGTVDYLHQLEREKKFLMSQNNKLNQSTHSDSDGSCNDLPLPKRKRRKIELVAPHLFDEGIGSASPSSQSDTEDTRHEIAQLRRQLEQERTWRLRLEEELKEREARMDRSVNSEPLDHDYTEHEVNHKTSSSPHLPSFHFLTTPHHTLNQSTLENSSTPLHLHTTTEIPRPVQTYPYDASKPRQNLAAIVEAIRHVEGSHMFQDDPSPVPQQCEETTIEELSIENKIIMSAPVVQNRAGVIVANTS